MRTFLLQKASLFPTLILGLISVSAAAQTVSLSDGSIVQSKTNRVGLNIGSISYYDNGQILKNLIGTLNPGFEPLNDRQIWALTGAGTTTSFTIPDVYDLTAPNYWAGATFSVVASQSNGAELGCTGTIASETGPNYPQSAVKTWVAPVVTVSSPCSAPFNVGDVVIMTKTFSPTPNTWWTQNGGDGGFWANVSGGGQFATDTTDLCPTCGKQSLEMDATASGSVVNANWYYDGVPVDIFVMMNGTYQLSFWAKAAVGNPTLNIFASRMSAGGFSCPTYTPTLTSTWTKYTFTCTASETAATTSTGSAKISFQVQNGAIYLDNVDFEKTAPTTSNPTVLRDEVIQTMQKYFGDGTPGPAGELRFWLGQNGETLDNWTQPDYAHGPSVSGGGYYIGPSGGAKADLSLQDYLAICQYLGVDPYLEVPVTFSTAEASGLMDYLAGPSSTVYGGRRAALGQTNPWTSVFDQIHLSFCNECWNGFTFDGQSLAWRKTAPNPYYDYGVRTAAIFSAMRQNAYYSQSSFDLVMNSQTGTTFGMDSEIQLASPDSIEIQAYTYPTVTSFATDAALWGPAMVEPYERVMSPSDPSGFYASVADFKAQKTCGASGNAPCNVNVYEWGQGTNQGTIDQKHLDYINVGAGEGVVMALQPLLNMQTFGIMPQAFFSLAEFQNGALITGEIAKLWGNVLDMGGATGNVRPEFLGVQLINQSIVGPMYSCPINNNLTYNFPSSPNGTNGTTPAMNNVPYMYSFCFENGLQRSVVLINTDLTNSHAVNFSGSNLPTGTVTQRQYAPANLDDMNEVPTGGGSSALSPAKAFIKTSTLSNPASITLPPHSVTALDYTAAALPIAATPTFTPAAGNYVTTQSVSINDSNAGVTIYYTTDGSTPTTSSSVYSGPITVAANMTVNAIAVETNFTTSSVATAAYTVAPLLPTPTFSVAAGTYTTSQSVTISDAQSGVTLYYTTDGTTPTTSSSVYSGPVTVSANETLKAIAVEGGFSTSNVASAAYVIAGVLPQPVFTAGAGTYSSAQSVTITDATPGTTIYYAINHVPTTASTVYTGPVTVSATETLEAIAVEGGYTNSPLATAVYTISGSVGYINYSSGGFSASSFALNNGATITSTRSLQLTDGGASENRSAWFSAKVPVQAFVTDFTFQQTNASADGMTFAIQGQGPTAVGYSGSGLGYQTITNSIAIKFDLFSNAGEGPDSTGLYTNGASPTLPSVDLSSTGINFHSGDVMDALLVYDGTLLTMTITDTETSAVAIEVFPVNIPSVIGANSAYVGFTGGTGGSTATQQVLSWTYVSTGSQGTTVAAPAFSLPAGTYSTSQSVTISDATSGSTIYYTTNGATPTTSSTVYSGPITVSASETLEAIAVKSGYSNSPVTTAAYTIGTALPAPTFSLAAGTYTTSQSVTISDAASGATIYYTTNGATPTTSSTVYSGAIAVGATETLEAIAVKTGSSNSPVATATYTISLILPAPAFSLASGTYTTSQTVTITAPAVTQAAVARIKSSASTTSSTATVYYTLDGTTPTTASTVYSNPIMVSSTVKLQAVAAASGYTTSPVAAAVYTIAPVLPAPTFSVAGGSYSSAQSVTISDATAGATIYYTTNGTTPTTSSSVYSGAVTVGATETLEALAVKTGYSNSAVATASYTITAVSTTYINYASSKFASTFLSLNGGATVTSAGVLQVTDGGSSEGRSAWYLAQVPVRNFVTDFTFQQLNPNADGMTFTIQGQSATALGNSGYSLGYQGITDSVAIKFDLYSNAGEGPDSTGLYTGGAAPTVPSIDLSSTSINFHLGHAMHAHMVYDGSNLTMTLTDTVTNASVTEVFPVNIPAIVGGNNAWVGFTGGTGGKTATQNVLSWSYSSTATQTTGAALSVPVFAPAGGYYPSSQTVTMANATAGTTIYYTTNGTTPSTASIKYAGPVTVSTTEKLEAIAVKSGYSTSPVGTTAYTIGASLPAPIFSKAGGTYPASQSVTILDSVPGATICFTTNGSTPTAASTRYTSPVTVSRTETLNAIAIKTGFIDSTVATAAYTIMVPVATPTFSRAAGSYPSAQSVAISDTTSGATIYFTTNGTTPTTASNKYIGAIAISKTATLKAIGVKSGSADSAVATAAYIIEAIVATPTFSHAAGTYTTAQSVAISDATAGATIYYTTNGTLPTTGSAKYTGPITVSSSQKLEAIAVKTGYVKSTVAAAAYTIAKAVAAPSFSHAGGAYTSSQSVTISDATTGATIHYTVNGTTPTAASAKYTGPISVSKTQTLKAIAIKSGSTDSAVATAAYVIGATVAKPIFSHTAGTYTTSQSVAITDATAGAAIHYTTNGTKPTAASARYARPISVSKTQRLEAIAVKTGYFNSSLVNAVYTIVAAK